MGEAAYSLSVDTNPIVHVIRKGSRIPVPCRGCRKGVFNEVQLFKACGRLKFHCRRFTLEKRCRKQFEIGSYKKLPTQLQILSLASVALQEPSSFSSVDSLLSRFSTGEFLRAKGICYCLNWKELIKKLISSSGKRQKIRAKKFASEQPALEFLFSVSCLWILFFVVVTLYFVCNRSELVLSHNDPSLASIANSVVVLYLLSVSLQFRLCFCIFKLIIDNLCSVFFCHGHRSFKYRFFIGPDTLFGGRLQEGLRNFTESFS